MVEFQFEKQLLPAITLCLPSLIQDTSSYAFTTEFSVGYRSIDVLVTSLPFQNHTIEESVPGIFARLTLADLAVLERIYTLKKVTKKRLKAELYIDSDEVISNYLTRLLRMELIQAVLRSYCVTDWSSLLPNELVSIELKLTDWRNAIKQAAYNSKFSDKSFIALPHSTAAENQALFSSTRDANIGVISVIEDDDVSIASPALIRRRNRFQNLQKLRVLRDMAVKTEKWEFAEVLQH